MCYSDDPVADFLRHEAEREKTRILLPQCARCREKIEDEELYDFDGQLICSECLVEFIEENFKKKATDYISEAYY